MNQMLASDVKYVPVPLGNPVTANSVTDFNLFGCPQNEGAQFEVVSVHASCTTVPIDADGTVILDLEHVDDSAADAKTELIPGAATAFNLEGLVANVWREVFRGSRVFDPGDSLNAEFTNNSAAIDTPAVGLVLLIGYRVIKRMANP